jgi:transketolase
MGQRVVFVMTHDSIGLGEDGPTHQPVEHLAALRAIPNLLVFRPCDAVETAECWELALMARSTPSVLALTRQNVPPLRTAHVAENRCAAGAYELLPASDGEAKVSLFASGSEVSIAVEARALLAARGVAARVVSVPCFDLFETAPAEARVAVIGGAPLRLGIEAGVRQGWDAIIGSDGLFVGMRTFGASAPAKDLFRHFEITPEHVAKAVLTKLDGG